MWLFGPPDIEKMLANHDVKGLTRSLRYKKDPDVGSAAAKALVRIGAPSVEPLIAVLKGAPEDIREAAVKALVKIGTPAVAPLVAALHHASLDVRTAAAEALGEIRDLRAVEPLVAAIQDSGVRQVAIESLIKIGDVKALVKAGAPSVDPLIAALEHGNPSLRRLAANALGQIGDPRAVELLVAVLPDGDLHLRRLATTALGQIGDSRAVESLIAVLQDAPVRIREAAAEALGQLGDPAAVEPLIVMLRHASLDMRKAAAQALRKIGDPRAIKPLEDYDKRQEED